MFNRFYPNALEHTQSAFVNAVLEAGAQLSIAELQAHFLLHKDDPQAALDHVEQLIQSSAWSAGQQKYVKQQ
jgi:hypothetical protein